MSDNNNNNNIYNNNINVPSSIYPDQSQHYSNQQQKTLEEKNDKTFLYINAKPFIPKSKIKMKIKMN